MLGQIQNLHPPGYCIRTDGTGAALGGGHQLDQSVLPPQQADRRRRAQ